MYNDKVIIHDFFCRDKSGGRNIGGNMKKYSLLSLLLALMLAVTAIIIPVYGTQAETTEETLYPTETVPPADATVPDSDVPFGSVCLYQGCRTIDGQVPLAGSDPRLKTARAVFIYERQTQTVVYAYNPDMELRPGALAKIVTTLIALERCNLDDIVTASSRNISRLPAGSKNKNIKEGEQFAVQDLLYCMIMEGANDAAIAIAEHVAGSMDAFVALMNQRVKDMGCTNTEFANVHGLDNAPQHTTARDMAKIVMAATENETFREIFSTVQYTVPATNRSEARELLSENQMMHNRILDLYWDERVTGGMQTYTSEEAGAGVVCTAESKSGDMSYVAVVLGATREFKANGNTEYYGNFEEMSELLKYAFNSFKRCRVLYRGQALEQFPVIGGECNVVGQVQTDLDSVLPADAHMENLIHQYTVIGGPTAPVAEGELIGTVELWYRNSCLLETELFAASEVRSEDDSGLTIRGQDQGGGASTFVKIVGIICLVVLIPTSLYLAVNSYFRYKRRSQRRRRREGRRRSR